MKTPLQHFSSRRLGAWQSEWEFLQRSVARAPGTISVSAVLAAIMDHSVKTNRFVITADGKSVSTDKDRAITDKRADSNPRKIPKTYVQSAIAINLGSCLASVAYRFKGNEASASAVASGLRDECRTASS